MTLGRADQMDISGRMIARGQARRVLVIYATPNGNTIEQTLGCAASKELDYRFDIQHVAAQVRRWREVAPEEDVILTVVQAPDCGSHCLAYLKTACSA